MTSRRLFLAGLAVVGAGALIGVGAWVQLASAKAEPIQCLAEATTSGTPAGMIWIDGGVTTLGQDAHYSEEGPPVTVEVRGFWIDQSEVTNAEFAAFVRATGYVTEAESQPREKGGPGSAVFGAGGNPGWTYVADADWRHPYGPGSSISGLDHHPVIHVTFTDAQAYASWKGRTLPTEAQFEHAARSGGGAAQRTDDAGGKRWTANVWQGVFPVVNQADDGYPTTAPVGCFPKDRNGAFDLIGNVWEWTSSPFYPTRDPDAAMRASRPEGVSAAGLPAQVIKGGSYLCAANYCARYRPDARQPQEADLSASHIGFRTVLNAAAAPGPSDRS